MIDIPVVFALLLFNLKFIRVIIHHASTHISHRCLYNNWIVFNFKCYSSSAVWINGFNIFYPPLNTFNSVFIPHTVWLYTLWGPTLYAHWRHLICISWPKDGRNAAETRCQKTTNLWVLHCCVWRKYKYAYQLLCFLSVLPEINGEIHSIRPTAFLQYDFVFIIHQSSCNSTLWNLRHENVVE